MEIIRQLWGITILATILQTAICSDVTRLNGGSAAERTQFPWQVQLSPAGINVNFSGIVIDEEWVLTCAACANKAGEYNLIFGAYNLSDPEEIGRLQETVTTDDIILHPEYDASHFNEKNIALIRLPIPLIFSAYINKAILPALGTNDTFAEVYARISGYGFQTDASEGRILRYTDTKVRADVDCRNLQEGQMCTEVSNGIGPCEDEGSALIYVENFMSIVIGIFSYGFAEGGCPGTTTLFTRTTTYLDWILSETNITSAYY